MNHRRSARIAALLLCLFSLPAESATTAKRSSSFEYDPVTGLLKKEIVEPNDPNQCLVTEYEYDDFGNKKLVRTRNCNGSAGEAIAPLPGTDVVIAEREIKTSYLDPQGIDKTGRFPFTTTNALGHQETREFDAKFGSVKKLTGPNGLVTTWTYDGFGRKQTETRADGTTTTWDYVWVYASSSPHKSLDANAKYAVLAQSSGSGAVYDYYDQLGRKLHSSRRNFADSDWIDEGRVLYDALGRAVKSYLPYERSTFATTARYATIAYDLLGRPIQQNAADGSVIEQQYGRWTQTTLHAPNTTEARKILKTTTVNVLGQTIKVVDALNNTLTYSYDPFGNLETTTDAAGNVTKLYYDKRGRKIQMDDPDMGTWYYYYNALGELIRQTDAKIIPPSSVGQTVTMTYDVLGRMLSRNEPDLKSTWEYDKLIDRSGNVVPNGKGIGKLAMAVSDNGYGRIPTYDDFGRLIKTKTVTSGTVINRASPLTGRMVIGTSLITQVQYDAYGRVDVQIYPTGFAVKNKYNAVGYLTSVVDNATQTTAYWTANKMDAAGHLEEQTYHNGVKIAQGFHPVTGRLETQTASYVLNGATINLQGMSYTYDTPGNLKTRNDNVNGAQETFGYDDLNRLTSATLNNISTPNVLSAVSYVAYDAIGNIVCKSDISDCGASTPNYTYNASGANSIRPHAVTGITGTLNGVTNPGFAYDANGNMTSGAGRTIVWTSFNMPREIKSCAGGGSNCKITTFLYNPEHERTTEIQTDGSTVITLSPRYDTGLHFEKRLKTDGTIEYEHYLYAGGLMFGKYVTQTNAAGQAIFTVDMDDTPRARVIEYYLKDHLGSMTALVNGDPNPTTGKYAVKFLSYDVWGKRRYADGVPDPSGALNNPDMYHGYTGHEHIDEVGLIHMNGRMFDPVMARFVSADFAIQNPDNLQSYNRYTYVMNNPLAGTDPSGQFIAELATWALGAILGSEAAYQLGIIDKDTARMIQGISVAAVLGPQGFGFNPVVAGFGYGFVSSDGSLEGGAMGALSAGLFYAAGTFANGMMSGAEDAFWGNGGLGRVMAHAAAGCAGGAAMGGGCGRGAMSAGFSEWAGPILDRWGVFDPMVSRAVVGGTVSVIGGGKFANGAVMASYGYLFNWLSHNGSFNSRFDASVVEAHYREGSGTPLDVNVSEIDGILNNPNNRWSQDANDPNRYTVATFGSDGFSSNSQGRALGSLTAIKQPNGSFKFYNDRYDFGMHELKLDRSILSTIGRNVETFFARPVVGSGRSFDIKIKGEWRPRGSLSGP